MVGRRRRSPPTETKMGSCGWPRRKAAAGRTRQAVLYAFDAAKIGEPIYSSETGSETGSQTNAGRDGAGMSARFVIPVVVNGRVYLGTRSEVDVYGLLK